MGLVDGLGCQVVLSGGRARFTCAPLTDLQPSRGRALDQGWMREWKISLHDLPHTG